MCILNPKLLSSTGPRALPSVENRAYVQVYDCCAHVSTSHRVLVYRCCLLFLSLPLTVSHPPCPPNRPTRARTGWGGGGYGKRLFPPPTPPSPQKNFQLKCRSYSLHSDKYEPFHGCHASGEVHREVEEWFVLAAVVITIPATQLEVFWRGGGVVCHFFTPRVRARRRFYGQEALDTVRGGNKKSKQQR